MKKMMMMIEQNGESWSLPCVPCLTVEENDDDDVFPLLRRQTDWQIDSPTFAKETDRQADRQTVLPLLRRQADRQSCLSFRPCF